MNRRQLLPVGVMKGNKEPPVRVSGDRSCESSLQFLGDVGSMGDVKVAPSCHMLVNAQFLRALVQLGGDLMEEDSISD